MRSFSTIAPIIPTRWTSGAAPGAGCSPSSASCIMATARELDSRPRRAAVRSGGLSVPARAGDGRATRPRRRPCRTAAILRILDALITVDGEKLSYRTLDVEQIGSVYETVMGFAVETRPGPAVAIKAGKNDRTPVFVDLAALAAVKGAERQKFLKEEAGRNALPDKVGQGARGGEGTGGGAGGACGRSSTSAARRAAMCRRRERRCCSRPTSAAAPAAITRRAR